MKNSYEIPSPILNIILEYSDYPNLFKKQSSVDLLKITENILNYKFNKLLSDILKAKYDSVDAALKQNSKHFLFKIGLSTDYSGRKIEGTPYQLAIGAHDIKMAKIIKSYLIKLPNGLNELIKQYNKQYPKKYKNNNTMDIKAVKNTFNKIKIATKKITYDSTIKEFHDYIDKSNNAIIKIGDHFNINIIIQALKLYNNHYDSFGGWNSTKNNICWQKIIGYLQRYLPANYALLYYNTPEAGSISTQKYGFYFPLDSYPNIRLGHEYAISPYGGAHWSAGIKWNSSTFKDTARTKQLQIKQLDKNDEIKTSENKFSCFVS
ncbi:hypothetical protein N9L02_00710 [Gammaproteobacteria bacterium]|nr:hypothetical protein [Gammaproteobacteria bacterium]